MVFGFFIKNVPVVVCFFRSVPNDDAIPYIIHQNAFSWMTRPGFASKQKDSFHLWGKKNLLGYQTAFSPFLLQAALIGKEFCGGFLSSRDVSMLPISGTAVVATK